MPQRDMLMFPSRGNHNIMKSRMVRAHGGLKLLQRKHDALQRRSRLYFEKIIDSKSLMVKLMKNAYLSMSEARYTAGDFNQLVLQNVDKAQVKVGLESERLSCLRPVSFEIFKNERDANKWIGLGKGGQQVSQLKTDYEKIIFILVDLASYQSAFTEINAAIMDTNKRINGLELIVIPNIHLTLAYIDMELNEQEREELYRLKMIRRKKQKAKGETIHRPATNIHNRMILYGVDVRHQRNSYEPGDMSVLFSAYHSGFGDQAQF